MRIRSVQAAGLGLAALVALIFCDRRAAIAQITGASINFNAGNSADNFQDDTFASFQRTSTRTTITNNGTTLATRYAFVNGTDTGLNTDQSNSQTCDYRVQFNVTAPGAYKLTVNTSRRGALTRVDDFPGNAATADISGVAATYTGSGTFTGGPLTLPDPPASSGTGNANTAFDANTAVATITGISNGVAIPQRFDFSWTTFCNSDSSFFLDGGDECAVRGGIAIAYGGETAGDYPGSGGRNIDNDGHFLTIVYESLCGNGVIDGAFGETCDQGMANGTTGSCCLANCTIRPNGQECRPATSICDVAETCNGTSPTCPTDAFAASNVVCRAASAGMECDFSETCTGTSAVCPPDVPQPNGFVCRPAAGVCDLVEVCDGVSKLCPSDAKSMAVCRPQNGVCDVAEACNGGNNCPADGFANASTMCRGAVDSCDAQENCPGNSPNCPADGVKPNGTACPSDGNACTLDQCNGVSTACQHPAGNAGAICRPDTGACDVAETCTGMSTTCPPDAFEPPGTTCTSDGLPCTVDQCDGSNNCLHPAGNAGATCRSAAGLCDVAEQCDGVATTCPPDDIVPSGTVCRAASPGNLCDEAEVCDGASTACPADAVKPSATVCRPAAGDCDLAEACDGVSKLCPSDAFAPSSTECRASAGGCDPAENCPGNAANCPANVLRPNGFSCRLSAGQCDVAESCDGVSPACPPDGFAPSGTPCRAAAGVCDVAETCTGTGTACPPDVLQPDGTSCADSDFCDGAESCMSGACPPSGPDPCGVGQSCDESLDQCFTGGCPPNAVMCRAAQKSMLVLKDKLDDGKDKLIWKWLKGANTTFAELSDPTTTANYALCFYAGPTESLIGSVVIPAGGGKWKASGSTGYKFKDTSGVNGGIRKVIVKGSTSNKAKALVKGKGAFLPDFMLPFAPGDLPVIVQLRNNQTGICWGSSFGSPSKNVEGLFKDKNP